MWQWEQWNQPKKLRNSVRIFQTSCLLVSVFAVCSTFKWIFSYCQHVKKRLIFNVSLFWFLIMFDIYFPSCKIRFTWNSTMKIKKIVFSTYDFDQIESRIMKYFLQQSISSKRNYTFIYCITHIISYRWSKKIIQDVQKGPGAFVTTRSSAEDLSSSCYVKNYFSFTIL